MSRVFYLTLGYTTHDRRFLEKLASSGHDVWFQPCQLDMIPSEKRPLPDKVHSLQPFLSKSLTKNPLDLYKTWQCLRARLKEINPDILHAGPVQTGGFLAATSGFHPFIVMSWGSDLLVRGDQNLFLRWLTRFTLRRADRVFADCQAVADKVISIAPQQKNRIVQFPWGIDLSLFKRKTSSLNLRKTLGWENSPVLIFTRGFEPIHDPLIFLEAFERVTRSNPDVRLILLGDGSLRSQVESFIEGHCLQSSIHKPGRVSHTLLADYFNESDLYVSSTSSDGSSISLLESMACGLPVIAVDGYGNREWVRTGQNGWLYPAGNVERLTGHIQTALSQKKEWERMSHNNMAITKQKADWNKNFTKLLDAYSEMLGRPNLTEVTHAYVA